MNEQAELNIGIGTLDQEKIVLKPAKVKIVSVGIDETPKAKKIVFECKHPSRENTIMISSVAHIVERQVKVAGTWLNLDKENKLQKGSALAVFLGKIGASSIKEAIGKEVETEIGTNNYLCFKAY